MSDDRSDFDHLVPSPLGELIASYRDGTATADELTALNSLIVSSTDAAEQLFAAAWQDVLLAELFQHADASDTLQSALSGWTEAAQQHEQTEDVRWIARPLRRTWDMIAEVVDTTAGVSALISGLFITTVLLSLALITMPDVLDRHPGSDVVAKQPQVLARITGTTNARWSDDSLQALAGDRFLFARQLLDLESGLVELRYDNGVTLIIEGPARFQLESTNSASLSEGQLFAQVPPAGHGFALHTPGVDIVDLGTEFGVRIGNDGGGELQTFKGAVEAEVRPGQAAAQKYTLLAGQSLVWAAGGTSATRSAAGRGRFVQRLPRLVPLALPNTGASPAGGLLTMGEMDPKWRVRQDGTSDWQPAMVVDIPEYARSATNRSMWISVPGDWQHAAGDCVYTFATKFTLSDVELETVRAAATFSADNSVRAVRLNGHELPLPPLTEEQFRDVASMNVDSHFVLGENELEIDVFNLAPSGNPMALRWEWIGRGQQTTGSSN